ncbi:MAG: RNA polymerase sigma factor [Bacteroidaceae bacterium]
MENEIELIMGCRAGENSARKELYTLYSKQMLAVCFRYVGDIDIAHDILHDGFVKIFTNFSFKGESSLTTWINKVMISQSIDYLRKKKRSVELVVQEDLLPDIPDIPESDDGAEIPEKQLLEFLAELPEGCRTVFNLYVFEEKSHKEIAGILHIKEHSSASQLTRARYLLANKINEYRKNEREK